MLTNGPGDPMVNTEVIENVRQLIGKLPMFGICLGHQIIALAKGAKTTGLKYGHRGFNHPVKDLTTENAISPAKITGTPLSRRSAPKMPRSTLRASMTAPLKGCTTREKTCSRCSSIRRLPRAGGYGLSV